MEKAVKDRQVQSRITRRQAIRMGGVAALGLVFTKPVIETINPPPVHASVSGIARTPNTMFHCKAVLTRNGVILQEKEYRASEDQSRVHNHGGYTLTIDCQPV